MAMQEPLRVAVIGVGRIGVFHARHVKEIGLESGACELVAVVDRFEDTAESIADRLQCGQTNRIQAFKAVEELLAAGAADAAVIASRTEHHQADAQPLIDGGLRVLLEKPLTHDVASSKRFVQDLASDIRRERSLMLAFMRRFDAPLIHAKSLLASGAVGRPFKVVSVLEDPLPPPDGYSSPGILPDMAVHNIDEVIWLLDAKPDRAAATGANLHNFRISPVEEDFDDALLQLGFTDDAIAHVQVSRNHVAGYRNETWLFGDRGVIHVGHFQGPSRTVSVEVCNSDGVIDRRDFQLRDYGEPVPVFLERFGPAYKGEVSDFVQKCLSDQAFSVTQEDGLTAMQIAEAGARSLKEPFRPIEIAYGC